MAVFHTSIDQPFLATLARGILERFGADLLRLASAEVLLPNRRSCRAFSEILLKESGKTSLILPRIHAIGDAEEELFEALSKPRRLLLYSEKLKAQFSRSTALAWAEKIAELEDECERYGADVKKLAYVEAAAHRETLLSLLAIIMEEKNITPEAARNALLKQKAESLKQATHPVIAAGSLGTIPATADLLRVIAALPEGYVILPGFEQTEKAVPPTHPQYALQKLIQKKPVMLWLDQSIHPMDPRLKAEDDIFIKNWFSPDFHPHVMISPKNISLLEADTDAEEAEAIAIALRETLETPSKTAILVTPDRKLARQVSAYLKKWDVTLDDSAGSPLSHTPLASLLLHILDAAGDPYSPFALLPLLKHPLCQFSRQDARELELNYFRKQKKPRGPFFEQVLAALKPLSDLLSRQQIALQQLISTQLAVLETFSQNPARPESEQLNAALAELLAASEGVTLHGAEYAGVFRQLFSHYQYRPAYGTHPRLSILSPIEARLMTADRIIIASLNDNFWPNKIKEDWLGSRLRKELGLPQIEEAIGHAAHDFYQLLGAKEVILSRARYVDGTPQNQHPWLIRLQALCTPQTAPYLDWIYKDIPAAPALEAPAPKPSLEVRPKTLSATDVRDLMQQPYRYYARKILKLNPLEPLQDETKAKDIGSSLHSAFEAYAASAPWKNPLQTLTRLIEDYLKPVLLQSSEWVLWQPRIPKIAAQFIAWDDEERAKFPHIHAEIKGSATISLQQLTVELHAKADRIAVDDAGDAVITDYKTGGIPGSGDIKTGQEPQLLVEKWMLEKGGFNAALSLQASLTCGGLNYWKISSNQNRAEVAKVPQISAEALHKEITALIDLFYVRNWPFSAIPLDYRNNPDPYAHLIRAEESFFLTK